MKNNNEFYSRQIGTFGLETVEKLSKIKILIIGLRGLGMEIAKNLILSGPEEVCLYDKNKISLQDLGSGFYFSEKQINKSYRDEGCLNKLSELNSDVKVCLLKNNLFDSIIKFNVVIISEIMDEEVLYKINNICRNNKIGFIYGCVFGLLGFIFVDFGIKFKIYDEYGEDEKLYYINNITNDKNCMISIDPSSIEDKFLSYGDKIKIKNIEGMTELNGIESQIKKINKNKIFLEIDTTKYQKYIKGGLVQKLKNSCEKDYISFKNNFENPICQEDFMDEKNIHCQRHCLIYGLHKYFKKYKKLPEFNDLNQAKEVLDYSNEYFKRKKTEKNEFFSDTQFLDEDYIKNLSIWSKAELPPYCNFFGGIISQEVVKFTGKYIPLEQWAWFDFYDSVKMIKNADRKLTNTRYDEQIAVYGKNLQNKLFNTNIFIIGAGALGCEYLKLFATMGISVNKNKKIIVTDNDNIELSNLNRQFLFRKCHMGKSKSKIACQEILKINNDINCEDKQNLVSIDTEDIYDENFWKSQDFVINAVDNIEARKYIDYQCTLFNKILIDSGTEGTKANLQLIIPKKTKCYNDTHIYGEQKRNIPMCTLRQFPSTIEHCIEWSKGKFNTFFYDDIKALQKLIKNPHDYLQKIENEENKFLILKKMKILLEIKLEKNIKKCKELSKYTFLKLFNYDIQNIINMFPKDYKNKDNTYFWSGAKKFPNVINFDINDEKSLKFIEYYSKILLHALDIKSNEYKDSNNNLFSSMDDISESISNLNLKNIEEVILSLAKNINSNSIIPENFDKDHDSNNHINFIYICSNLRARNYQIEECDKLKVKLIAGKIIPAVSSTTSSITGYVASQIYTLLYSNDINLLKEIRFNIATNSYFISYPQPVIEKKNFQGRNNIILAIPEKWKCWDHIEIQGPMTIKEFFNYVKKNYNITVRGLFTYEKKSLIKNKDMLDYKIENAFSFIYEKELIKMRRTLSFTIDGKTENKNSVIMPVFIYRY